MTRASGKRRKMVGYILIFGVVLALAFMAYARLSPLSIARWHQPIAATSNEDMAGGAVRILPGDAEKFAQINAAMAALPRTQVLAGSVQSERVTYVTRTAVFGFPDLTTIELRDAEIVLYARLRFGVSDMGVNRKRLERLIDPFEGG